MRKVKWALLVGGDIGILYLALWIMLRIRFGDLVFENAWQQHVIPFSFLYAAWILIFYIFGLYDLRLAKNNASFYLAFLKALGLMLGAAIVFFYLTPFFGIAPKTNLLLVTTLVFLLLVLWRQLYNLFITYPIAPDDILLIGLGAQVLELQKHIEKNPQLGYRICGVIEPRQDALKLFLRNTPKIHKIIIAFPAYAHVEFVKVLFEYTDQFVFEHFFSLYERITGRVPLSQIDEVWFLHNLKERERNVYEMIKRVFDIAFGSMLALCTLIFLPFITLAIKLDNPGPIFYSQARIGKNGKLFLLAKFRSMVVQAEENGAVWAQKHDPRITRVGKILRKTFLDEFPQCMNILKGEMSLIGPRPERPEFVEKLAEEIPFYRVRHIVKPGITGWAQVNTSYGNSTHGALEKLQYDLYYIKNRSFLLDLKILLKTVNVISRGGTQ